MITFLVAIIALHSTLSLIDHIHGEIKLYKWRKKTNQEYKNYQQEWTDIV